MKKLLALFLCMFAASSFGAVYQNQTTSNAVPYISTLKGTNVALFTSTNYGQFTTTNLSGMTNSKVAIVDGGIHLPSALFGGSWPVARGTNYYGGQINWWHQADTFPPPSEGGTTYTPMGAIGTFEQWGGAAVSAISPWMLVTAPNIRFENGYGVGYGEIALGNEDAAGSIYLNWNRGPTLSQYDTANYKGFSIPLSFEADVTDANTNHHKVFPGIVAYASDYNANADPNSGLRQGELYFQSLTAYRLNGGWAQNGANAFGSNTVFRMRTNMVTFDGSLGILGTSKTHINGGSITNTDIISKIIGTDSNGKFTGATLSGLTWDGTTLTASGSGTSLFNTNAPAGDGTFTNSNSGGASNVYVGPAYWAVTNGGAIVNAGKTPGMLHVLNNGVSTLIDSNTITTGSILSSGGVTNTAGASEFRHNAFVPLVSVRQTTSNGRVGAVAITATNTSSTGGANLGALSYYMLENASSAVNYAGAVGAYWLDGSQNSALVFNVVNGGSDPANRNDFTLKNVNATTADGFLSGAFTATNGLCLPQLSAIPSVDLRSSSGNTNWVFFNLGGDSGLFKTNPAAASSYLTNWLTVQLNFVQGSTAGTPVSLTTATAANITSISLTPGTWDLTGNIYFDFVGATVTSIEGAISTTSATISSPPPEEVSAAALNLVSTSADSSLNITRRRVTITSTTTYYLVGRAAFSVGSIDGYGKLLATRVN